MWHGIDDSIDVRCYRSVDCIILNGAVKCHSNFPTHKSQYNITLHSLLWIGLSSLLLSNVVHTNITMSDSEIKEETEVEVEEAKSDVEEGLEDAGEGLEDASDKVQAGAKAVAKKVADPDKDLETEYQKEKIEEKMD